MKTKLTNKRKSKIRREVDLEMGVKPPKSTVFVNKKKYNRKKKHKKINYYENDISNYCNRYIVSELYDYKTPRLWNYRTK